MSTDKIINGFDITDRHQQKASIVIVPTFKCKILLQVADNSIWLNEEDAIEVILLIKKAYNIQVI